KQFKYSVISNVMAAAVKSATSKFSILSSLKRLAPRTYFTYVNEPAQPIPGKEPKWTSLENAFEILKSGQTVFVQGAAATP
uniref:hypothetical protein n=1 Tax=Staphylococcus aureus TaxID=1280 RepID=UPI0038B2ED53